MSPDSNGPGPESGSEGKSESEAGSESEVESESKPESEVESESKPESEVESEGEADVDVEPETGSVDSDRGDRPGVLLFMRPGRDRELLAETLGRRYRVETTTDVGAIDPGFDCVVFDTAEFNRVAGTVQPRRDTSSPVSLPFVLLIGERSSLDVSEAWSYVDDVIELPVEKTALLSRIGNLVERRRTAVRLAEREAQLEQTVEDLALKEQAMDEAPVGITIAEPGEEDDPLVYVNEEFETLTGYGSDVIGEDCRFLQGEGTDPGTVREIREAIEAERPVSVDVLNYRADGRRFWNNVNIAPIRDEDGNVRNFVGFQTDITERKIRERRLEVLNRVLSHNLRNKMNVIEGHSALLRETYDGEPPDSLEAIEETTTDIIRLAESVRKVERIVSSSGTAGEAVALDQRLEGMVSAFRDRFPAASFDLSLPGGSACEVAASGLVAAIEEAVENAVEHNDRPEPSVEIRVERRPDGWLDVEIRDDGPGIPAREVDVLEEGETPLDHADRLGIWLIYWVISKAGGEFSVSRTDEGGTRMVLSVPATE